MLKLSLSPAFIKFIKKTARLLAIAAAIIAVTGFLILPAILRPILEKKISETIHRGTTIRKVYINPFTLAFALKGVTINQRDSSDIMLSFDEFYVNVQSMSVVKGGLIVSSVRLVKPYVNVTRNKDLSYNFIDLLGPGTAPPKEVKPKELFKFSINNIEVVNGSADFYDVPRNTRHTLRDVNIAVPFLSNLPYYLTSYVQPSLQATVNGNAIAFKGKTLPFAESLETTLDINLIDVNLPYYLAYSPVHLNFRLSSGVLDLQATISFKQFKDRPPIVSVKGAAALKDVRFVDKKKKPRVEFSLLSVSFLPSDLMEKEVHLSDVGLRAPKIDVQRDHNGEMDILTAFELENTVVEDKPKAAAAYAAPPEAAPLPVIDIDSLSISDGTVLFTDWQPVSAPTGTEENEHGPVKLTVDKIAFKGSSLSTRKNSKGTLELSLNLNGKGFLRTSGTIALNPLDLDTAVTIGDIALRPFQPYIAQQADVLLTGGRFATTGTVRVRATDAKGVSATYRGSASLNHLAMHDSHTNDHLMIWKSLRFDNIDAGFNPLYVKIRTISLSDFFALIVVEGDGTLNLQNIAKKEPASNEKPGEEKKQEASPSVVTEQVPADSGTPPDITIQQMTLKGGSINFVDKHIKPMFTANLLDMEGTVSGLSSKEDRMADVLLRGSFDRYAPLVISGKINPLGRDLFVDIKAEFRDMELSPLTPYSGTYIGNAIEKGKLSFALQYHIEKKKLEAKNDILIDQLTLGEKIDSPKATKLPVGFAISLLKDRNGEIKLDIPVSGEIDNPEFSIWRIVLKVLVNLLVKAATSPFALLSSLMGGEELGYVEFDYGASAVTEQNANKIDNLVNALYDRPALKLEIAGYVDPANDSEGLRAERMKSMIVAQKIKDQRRKGGQQVSPESVQISAAEYPIYLKKAYKSGKFSKPRNLFGFAKDLPDAEMEKLLLASIQINDDDLRQLASLRARTIRDLILKPQKIEPERVFLIEPKSFIPEQKDKLKNSRVEFSLK